MLGSAIATAVSDIPFAGPCAMTQIGMIDGELLVNPGQNQQKVSDLKLTVASTSSGGTSSLIAANSSSGTAQLV